MIVTKGLEQTYMSGGKPLTVLKDIDLEIEADPGNGKLLARLREWGEVLNQEFKNGTVHVQVRLPVRHVEAVRREGGTILSGLVETPDE